MGQAEPPLRSQRLRLVNHQGDALRLGMNWTEEDLAKPQVMAVLLGIPVSDVSVDLNAILLYQRHYCGSLGATEPRDRFPAFPGVGA